MATYEELISLMEGCTGSCCFWKRWYFANFGYTDGVKLFCEKAKAHWFVDVVGSYISKLKKIDDYFFKIVLQSKEEKSIFKIIQEKNCAEKDVIIQYIPYMDLPEGENSFFLIRDYEKYTLMVPEEY
ncbi:MAG: hypothetical protein K5766_02880 [Alphaproteobacteria bacterium]|nr:hypothetical protein [Alphaproteobacteria bacterium]